MYRFIFVMIGVLLWIVPLASSKISKTGVSKDANQSQDKPANLSQPVFEFSEVAIDRNPVHKKRMILLIRK
jgi:hypothetical protein